MMDRIMVTHPFNGPHFAGIKRVIQSVTAELVDEFDVEILTPPPSDIARENLHDSIEFRTFEKRLPGWGMDYLRPSVKRMMEDADVIWNHTFLFNSAVASVSTPSVFTYHSFRKSPPMRFPRSLAEFKDLTRYRLMKRGFRYMNGNDRVVCISDKSRNEVEASIKTSSIRIYNGADYLGSEVSPDDEGYIFWSDGTAYLPYVARRIDYPIKLLDAPPGYGELENVEVIQGTVSDDRIRQLYRDCSFFVSNCFNEGFGLPPLEANFFGKPSIVIDKHAHDENFEDGVNGFKAASASGLLESVRLLVEDESLRDELGESAYERVSDRFTWESAASRYGEEFRSVIENSRV